MLSEEEQRKILENFSNEEILEIVNSALPKKSQIDQAKGDLLIPEAKKLMFLIQKEKGFSDEILLAKEFISLAKKDLETGNQRYKKQDFPTAIYHLQQATEKITKGYGLAQGIFTKKDLREISHKTPRAFVKMMNDKKVSYYIQSLKTIHPSLQTDASALSKLINSKEEEINLALLTYDQIKAWLQLIDIAKNNLKKTNLDKVLRQTLPLFSENLQMPSFPVSKLMSNFMGLYLISCLTYPHESFTRYPDKSIKPNQYTMDLGIVKAAPEIFKILDESVKLLEKYVLWKKPIIKNKDETTNKIQAN